MEGSDSRQRARISRSRHGAQRRALQTETPTLLESRRRTVLRLVFTGGKWHCCSACFAWLSRGRSGQRRQRRSCDREHGRSPLSAEECCPVWRKFDTDTPSDWDKPRCDWGQNHTDRERAEADG